MREALAAARSIDAAQAAPRGTAFRGWPESSDMKLTPRETTRPRIRSRAGYSVYDGREVQGAPAYTISRGEVLLDHGKLNAPRGRGRWLKRGPAGRL